MSDHDDGPPDDVDDEELAEMADELSTVLRELRDELQASREAREGGAVDPPATGGGDGEMSLPEVPFDMPSATDVLAFTDEKLIPAAITVLEVNIRALELLRKGIRWARPDRAGENAERVRSHAESVSRSTLQRLDTVLADLQEAAGEGALPEDAEASGIIGEARRLRDEIDRALEERAEARDEEPSAEDGPGEDADEDDGPPGPWGEQPEVDVDVEGELESIKAELGKDDEDENEEAGQEDEDAGPKGEDTGPEDEDATDEEVTDDTDGGDAAAGEDADNAPGENADDAARGDGTSEDDDSSGEGT